MRERDVGKSLAFLLKHRIIEEVGPQLYRCSTEYLNHYRRSLEKYQNDKRSKEPSGEALVLTLGEMVYPATFSRRDVAVLLVIHQKELGFR